MLNQTTLEQCVPLAKKLSDKGKVLQVVPETPLDHITRTTSTFGMHVEGQSLQAMQLEEGIGYLIESSNYKDANGVNEHGATLAEFVGLAKDSVTQSLAFVRNTVLSDIKVVLETVQNAQASQVALNAMPFEIVPAVPGAVFSNPLLLELVERFSETVAVSVPRRHLPAFDLLTLKSLVKTGAAQFDGEIDGLLGKNDDYGYGVVIDVLSGARTLDEIPEDLAIGVHLATKNLTDEPLEGTQLSLMDFNNHISLLIQQSGRMTYQYLETLQRRVRNSGLYLSSYASWVGATEVRQISVDNGTYVALLDKGLTPEAVIANEILGRRFRGEQLVENNDYLVEVYQREQRLRAVKTQLEANNLLQEAIARVISLEIINRPEEALPIDRASLQKRAAEFCARIAEEDLKNLPALCRDLVCFVFYAHTDALLILRIMDSLGEAQPELAENPRELALLTTIRYVAYWVAKQIQAN